MKEELLKIEMSELGEEIPLLDLIYVIPTEEKHDSGFNCMEIIGEKVGIDGKTIYKKKLARYSDVFQIEKIFAKDTHFPLSMDVPEIGVMRFFSLGGKFDVRFSHISSFVFTIVRE